MNMKRVISLCLLALNLSVATSAFAADNPTTKVVTTKKPTINGEALHNKKCLTCHDDNVYSRKDRVIKSMPSLVNQVNNCMKNAAKAQWTPVETDSVITFLNKRYYKF